MIRKFVSILLRLTSIPFFIRELIQRKRVTIIFYHDIDPDTADKHFKTLKSKYNIIALKDYIKAKKLGKDDKLPTKSLIITFDDGFKSNYELKPILEKHEIPATIFLSSGIVGTKRHFWWKHNIDKNTREYLKNISDEKRLEILRKLGFEEKKEFQDRQALSKNEIEEMKNIVDFQSHTMFHPILPECSTERAYKEISHSKIDLENNYGFRIYALSYPNGNYSDREISIAKKAGYECGITVDLGFNSQNTDLFKLKRIHIDDDADTNELLVRTSGLWDCIWKILKKLKALCFMSITNVMNKWKKVSDNMHKFILISLLVISMLLLTNFTQESIIFIILRNILAIIFILFLSGYTLVSILFQEKKLEFSEFLIHCIGVSICISILFAMIVHSVGMKVNFVNILNIISVTSIILAILNFLKIPLKEYFGDQK